MSKGMIPLSLCMIVKNEESVLPRCLKSVRSLVWEVIVVDTGSTDATQEVASEFGAKTFDFQWKDSFAEARNFSLDRASGEWILILDADEVLVYDSEKDFGRLLRDPEVEGYFARIVNLLGKSPEFETSEDLIVRLFRNKPEYRFEGSIHEQVRPAITRISGEKSLKRAPLTIYHDGYLSEVKKRK